MQVLRPSCLVVVRCEACQERYWYETTRTVVDIELMPTFLAPPTPDKIRGGKTPHRDIPVRDGIFFLSPARYTRSSRQDRREMLRVLGLSIFTLFPWRPLREAALVPAKCPLRYAGAFRWISTYFRVIDH